MPSLEQQALHDDLMADMAKANCMREAALMLAVALTGVDFDFDTIEHTSANVAAVAQEYGATPEDVQRVLMKIDPDIATGHPA
jgi:hypothetical protein